jgi:hypothetical protein
MKTVQPTTLRPTAEEVPRQRRPQGDRAPYSAPKLEVLGHLQEITLGSVGPFPESGGGFFAP